MKTPAEYLETDGRFPSDDPMEHIKLRYIDIFTLMRNYAEYHIAQFQSQPSISAEEYLKEKGIFDETDRLKHIPMKSEFIKILTDYASRQGKVVTVKRGKDAIGSIYKECSSCEHPIHNADNYCGGCGSKINRK